MTDLASTITLRSTQPARLDAVPNKGPFASEDEALRVVVQRLVDTLDPNEVWLFGSRAEGVHQPDSGTTRSRGQQAGRRTGIHQLLRVRVLPVHQCTGSHGAPQVRLD